MKVSGRDMVIEIESESESEKLKHHESLKFGLRGFAKTGESGSFWLIKDY